MADWSAWTAPQGGGLLGANPWQYISDIGFGLLANSGPSLQPQGGFGSRLGRAGQYASQMEGERLLNDARRQEIAMSAQEIKGMQDLQAWMKANPDATPDAQLSAALTFMPQTTMKGWVSNLSNPLIPLQLIQGKQAIASADTENQAKKFEFEQDYSALRRNYMQQHGALAAINVLESVPGAEELLNSPAIVHLAQSGISANKFLDEALKLGGEVFYGIPKDQQKRVLSAIYTVNKAVANVSTNTQRAVAAQATAAQGMGEGGAPLDVRKQIFSELFDETKRLLGTNPEWKIPETHHYAFEDDPTKQTATTQPPAPAGMGYQNGQIVTQPPSVYTPLPQQSAPAAASPPPPQPRKVRTVPQPAAAEAPVNPETGAPFPVYNREADANRALPKGTLYIIYENGEPVLYASDGIK